MCYTESREARDTVVIDSHIHLDADQYADVAGLIKRARDAGVNAVVAPGIRPSSNQRVMELAAEYPEFVHAAIGFHPEALRAHRRRPGGDALDGQDASRSHLRDRRGRPALLRRDSAPRRHYRARTQNPRALCATRKRTRPGADSSLPASNGRRRSEDHQAAGVRRAVFHWHKSDEATTHAILEAGYFISLTPEVVYRDRDQALARIVPLDHLMVETDGPSPYGGPFQGKPTEPNFIADVISAIASIRGNSIDAIVNALTANAESLFGITG